VPLGRPVVEDGVTFWYFRRQTRFYTGSLPLSRWLAGHATDYDLIHLHALFSFSTTAAAFWAVRRGVPYVVRPLGTLNTWGIENRRPWLKQLSMRLIERRVLAKAVAVHFTSTQERDEAQLVAPCARGFVIPNPVVAKGVRQEAQVAEFLTRHPEIVRRRIVLFLSRLDPKKGLDVLLQAFAKVRAMGSDAALVIAGDGEPGFVRTLKAEAENLGVAKHVIWTGFVDGEEKWAVLAAADVFVLPSYSENFGIAVVEATAYGLPVIVSNQVAIHREIAEAFAGLVVHCDAGETAGAILRMLEDEELRSRLARNALALADRFKPEAVTKRLVRQYHELLSIKRLEDATAYSRR